ncbi:MAG: T9SS type A sorting domain-containing protein [Bacteroidales bacterium]|nr:T9SS type A sorting domain-containing protein [Bacteroidales bacterium]
MLFTIFSHADGWRENEMQVKVFIKSQQDAQELAALRLNGDYFGKYAILYLVPSELQKIQNLQLDYEIQIENLNEHYRNFWTNRDDYTSFDEIIDIMDSLATAFPDICSKTVYGSSVDGRELSALKISDNVEIDEPEAEVMFDGGIHGDEIGCSENLIRFSRYLCYEYGNDQYVTDLINDREIWIYVCVNPDGRVNTSRYNSNGVDLNRDWGYMWDEWGNSPGAFSQPESKALRECMYNNQFVIHTSYHSGTEYISYPWSYRSDPCPDQSHIDFLANVYSTQSGYANLEYGQGNSGMYAINGSTKDSNYGIMGSVSWSMEISYDKQPPASQIMMYYNYNKPSMLAMIEYSGYGIKGNITDSETGDPVAAAVFVDDYFPCYTDPEVGDYHKYVGPGTYDITVKANGYVDRTIYNVEVSSNTSLTIKNIIMNPDTVHYAYRFSASQIPNNNEADEGDTPAVLGPPDDDNYSIGKNGWVVIDMQNPVVNGPGEDFFVYEGDDSPEGYTCFVSTSIDGPWHEVGNGSGTTGFDLSTAIINSARYVRIEDDGDGQSYADNAGFDLDAIEAIKHPTGVYLALADYYPVDTLEGNGNYLLDPGETSDIVVELENTGENSAQYVTGTLDADPLYVTVNDGEAVFGNISHGDTASGTFNVSISNSAPIGHTLIFNLHVTSNNGNYTNSYQLAFTIGQIPLAVIDLDFNHNSGSTIHNTFEDMDMVCEYETVFPEDLSTYEKVFLCLGTYPENYALSEEEGQQLATFLDNGGRLYMEGGDTWFYDDPTAVHPYFEIEGLDDGGNNLSTLEGSPGTWTEGMNFTFEGDNQYIDQIAPLNGAQIIFSNESPAYHTAVANETDVYRTIGSSFEFGGLMDGTAPSTKQELLQRYIDFFDGIYTFYEENLSGTLKFMAHPNPFTSQINIEFYLHESSSTCLEIFDQQGKKLKTLLDADLQAGLHQYNWFDDNAKPGLYLINLKTASFTKSIRVLKTE